MIREDEGYFFGLGAFETIAVEYGKPVWADRHLRRLAEALTFLGIDRTGGEINDALEAALENPRLQQGRYALKLTISEQNILTAIRPNPYDRQTAESGFVTAFSSVRRNETSPLVCRKTLNYGDCILEKRRAAAQGIDEPVFLNTRGEITEGAVSNVFFVREGSIITPPVSCGLLPGIAREVLMERYEIREEILRPEDAAACEEMFLTNSLMGVVPVRRLGSLTFSGTETGMRLARELVELKNGTFGASSGDAVAGSSGDSAGASSVDAR